MFLSLKEVPSTLFPVSLFPFPVFLHHFFCGLMRKIRSNFVLVHDLVGGVQPVAPAAEHQRFAEQQERLDDVGHGAGAEEGGDAVDGAVTGSKFVIKTPN